MKRHFIPLCLLAVLLVLTGLALSPQIVSGSDPAQQAPAAGQIAFVSYRDGNSEIYVMNADGSDLRRLTDNSARDESLAWSLDGSQIAFMSDRDGNKEIYVMNADGGDPHRLTNNNFDDWRPVWSPDGSQIAFESDHDGNSEIYVMNADGSHPRRLTNNNFDDWRPVWSPDGSQIAFESDRDGNSEIYVINTDGNDPRNLTNSSADDNYPAWSPDASQIVFESSRDRNSEIYVMNADGINPRRLTSNSADDWFPTWSPDGSQIAFQLYRDEIYVMNADGSDPRNLTNNTTWDGDCAWSPDGGQIAFTSERDGNLEVYVMNADGSRPIRLTDNSAYDWLPAWRPVPQATAAATPTPLPTVTSNQVWTPVIEQFGGVEMVLVPAGCFTMGSTDEQIDAVYHQCEDELAGTGVCDPVWFLVESYPHEVCFDQPFWMDRTEVTNAQFAAFDGQAAEASAWPGPDNARNVIDWSEARDFCEQRGARLPTEAEWEYAARGPSGWQYPWGNEFAAENVVYTKNFRIQGQPVEVGRKPGGASWVGALDMSGNVAEWVADWFALYTGDPQVNPSGPASGDERVLRGGSWYHLSTGVLRTAARSSADPGVRLDFVGFRCARSAGG